MMLNKSLCAALLLRVTGQGVGAGLNTLIQRCAATAPGGKLLSTDVTAASHLRGVLGIVVCERYETTTNDPLHNAVRHRLNSARA